MPYKLLYFDEAKRDVKEAKAWYRKQQKGLEKRFADAVKNVILHLKERPSVYGVRYKNVRIAHAEVFPYAIHFYIDEPNKMIVIIAVLHNSRNPDLPFRRI